MRSYGISHKGYVRNENQDAFINIDAKVGPMQNIYVVADGMGGHKGGAMASRLAVDTMVSYLKKSDKPTVRALVEGVNQANDAIFNVALNNGELFGMGTTIDAITIEDELCHTIHVGDSRIYAVNDHELVQLTKDHSYVQ